MKTFETFSYGKVTLRECFDADSSMNGEGFIEVTDQNNEVFAIIHGDYDIDDMTADEVESLIDENLVY